MTAALAEVSTNPLISGEDFIEHYGVKGMKWGQLRTRAQIDADSSDVVEVKAAKEKISSNRTTNVLSNKELQAVVTRMNLEQQYKRLVSEQGGKKGPLDDFVESGKSAAVSMGVQYGQNKLVDVVSGRNAAAGAALRGAFEFQKNMQNQGKKKKNK